MKEENKEKGKGWHEKIDQMCIGKDGEPKARKHHEVALKKEFEKQGFSGATKISPHEDDIISVRFNVEKKDLPEFNKATEKFMKENDIEVETEAKGDSITVQLPVVNLERFIGSLDNKFKLESDEEKQVKAILEKGNTKIAKKDSKNPNKSDSKDTEANKGSD